MASMDSRYGVASPITGQRTVAGRRAALLMTLLLMRVSGVPLLEEGLKASKPGYRAYVARTPAFFPWFPRGTR